MSKLISPVRLANVQVGASGNGSDDSYPWRPLGGLYSPPGFLNDLTTPAELQGWDQKINDMIEMSKWEDDGIKKTLRTLFFNHKDIPDIKLRGTAQTQMIPWTAFPNIVRVDNGNVDIRRWPAADSDRSVQDEYCEWSVTRNAAGKITKVTFTAEGPEYWEYLGEVNPAKVLALYQQFVNQSVQMEDLFDATGKYIPANKWNRDTTNGAMHLIQRANTLGAEVELAGGATVIRKIGDAILEREQDLIKCSRYGQPKRNSDPFIGGRVNELARKGMSVMLVNPVGLYINGLDTSGWTTPDGKDPAAFWTIERGSKDFAVRCKYEVPPEAAVDYVVGDITFSGAQKIQYGSQIADFITIKLTGLALKRPGRGAPPPEVCLAPPPPPKFSVTASASDKGLPAATTQTRPSRLL